MTADCDSNGNVCVGVKVEEEVEEEEEDEVGNDTRLNLAAISRYRGELRGKTVRRQPTSATSVTVVSEHCANLLALLVQLDPSATMRRWSTALG